MSASAGYSYEDIEIIAGNILTFTKHRPRVGIVCGSGLGNLADKVEDAEVVSYSQIKDFPATTVVGHEGKLVFGLLQGKPVVIMVGRFHYYEGYPMWKVAMPVRVMKLMGVTTLILTSASGGVNAEYKTGDIMIMKDHIDLPGLAGECVLVGKNDERFGPRFVATTDTYDKDFRDMAKRIAVELGYGSIIREGTLIMVGGPTYVSLAEMHLLRLFRADAVCMSTVPEAVAAKHVGLRTFGISLVTDVLPPPDCENVSTLTHEEVLEVAEKRGGDLQKIVTTLVGQMTL